MTPDQYVVAMRADGIPAPQDSGLWYIQRQDLGALFATRQPLDVYLRAIGAFTDFPTLPHVLTSLNRWTEATLHQGHGESVMSDDPKELRKHLPVVLRAHGRVLVSGLGLGCVVRGLLANERVEHIDVIEIDADVLSMMAPAFASQPRVQIHQGDALTYRWPRGTRWDFAWHDIWSEDTSLPILHSQLFARYQHLAPWQGAWGMPRWIFRLWPWPLLNNAPEKRRLAL